MDFGIARLATEETSGMHVRGKLRYMPPEQQLRTPVLALMPMVVNTRRADPIACWSLSVPVFASGTSIGAVLIKRNRTKVRVKVNLYRGRAK